MLREDDLTTLSDFYEFTMLDGFLNSGKEDTIGCFDAFFREVPDKGGFVIAAGLESIVKYLKSLKFLNRISFILSNIVDTIGTEKTVWNTPNNPIKTVILNLSTSIYFLVKKQNQQP